MNNYRKSMQSERKLSGSLPLTPLRPPTINPDVVSTVNIILNMIDGSKVEQRCKNMDDVIIFLTRIGGNGGD